MGIDLSLFFDAIGLEKQQKRKEEDYQQGIVSVSDAKVAHELKRQYEFFSYPAAIASKWPEDEGIPVDYAVQQKAVVPWLHPYETERYAWGTPGYSQQRRFKDMTSQNMLAVKWLQSQY